MSGTSTRPLVFIGSSSEGLPVARALHDLLQSDAEVEVWDEGTFKLSRAYMEDLEAALDRSDFAILTLTTDDFQTSRGVQREVPRDNVLFELGLFMGRLGRDRCYFVHDATQDLKLPSDLLGISGATYQLSGDLARSLEPVVTKIRGRIQELRIRPKLDAHAIALFHRRQAFGQGISGQWWQRMKPDDESALSYMTIASDAATGSVRMYGKAFGLDKSEMANWQSEATAMNVGATKIFYYWTGWHPRSPNDRYEGFGEFRFHGSAQVFNRADGIFSNTNLSDIGSTFKKSFQMRRVTEKEREVMEGTDSARIRELITSTLDSFL